LDLPALFKEAQNVQASGFLEVIEQAIGLLKTENGQVGNFSVTNRLVELEPQGEATVIGDLHGDLQSLAIILENSGFVEKVKQKKVASLVFLGDYGDRGSKSAEVFYVVLKLKLAFPGQVVLLRGNHEGTENLAAQPNDLPAQFQRRFRSDWSKVYEKVWSLFPYLYNAVYVKERYLMVHGGISPAIGSLQDIAQAHDGKNEDLLADLLWSDPTDEPGVYPNPRGAGKTFGPNITSQVLDKINAKILIRGHQPCTDGYSISQNGKVLTLFSRTGAPYYNHYGAFLQMPLSEEFENSEQLKPFIRKF
jgi:protein phosphatase